MDGSIYLHARCSRSTHRAKPVHRRIFSLPMLTFGNIYKKKFSRFGKIGSPEEIGRSAINQSVNPNFPFAKERIMLSLSVKFLDAKNRLVLGAKKLFLGE